MKGKNMFTDGENWGRARKSIPWDEFRTLAWRESLTKGLSAQTVWFRGALFGYTE